MAEAPTVYLDNAATTYPKPEVVYQAVDRYLRACGGSPGRGSHRKAREAEEVVVGARGAVASLLGARDPARIVFTTNATESINLAVQGALSPGDHAVVTDLEHNAVMRPIEHLREQHGLTVSVVASSPEGFVEPAAIAAAITARTRLIACVHANNVLGTIQPVAEVGAIARARGIPFLIDASQSAGVLTIDVEALGVDFLAFTGHKGLYGPQGTGGLYIREGARIEPLKFGGTGIASESLDPPKVVPEGYEPGTFNTPGLAGLRAGVDFVAGTGVEVIRAHELELAAAFAQQARAIPGLRLYGPSGWERKVGIAVLNFEALDPADVGRILDRRFGVMVRTGLQCAALTHRKLGTERKGAVRFAFGYYNTPADVERAAQALREIAGSIFA